jgi:hypothetical protein
LDIKHSRLIWASSVQERFILFYIIRDAISHRVDIIFSKHIDGKESVPTLDAMKKRIVWKTCQNLPSETIYSGIRGNTNLKDGKGGAIIKYYRVNHTILLFAQPVYAY